MICIIFQSIISCRNILSIFGRASSWSSFIWVLQDIMGRGVQMSHLPLRILGTGYCELHVVCSSFLLVVIVSSFLMFSLCGSMCECYKQHSVHLCQCRSINLALISIFFKIGFQLCLSFYLQDCFIYSCCYPFASNFQHAFQGVSLTLCSAPLSHSSMLCHSIRVMSSSFFHLRVLAHDGIQCLLPFQSSLFCVLPGFHPYLVLTPLLGHICWLFYFVYTCFVIAVAVDFSY